MQPFRIKVSGFRVQLTGRLLERKRADRIRNYFLPAIFLPAIALGSHPAAILPSGTVDLEAMPRSGTLSGPECRAPKDHCWLAHWTPHSDAPCVFRIAHAPLRRYDLNHAFTTPNAINPCHARRPPPAFSERISE